MTWKTRTSFVVTTFLLSSISIAGQGMAATCMDQIDEIAELTGIDLKADPEAKPEDANNPLVVTMADGSQVDLRGDAPVAKPFENWFGDPIKRKELEGRIVKARLQADLDATEGCLDGISRIENWFKENASRTN
jgi:hypothetical protein